MNTKKEIEALIDYAIQLETRITRLEYSNEALNIANSKLLFAWQMHVNELNGDKHGIPDPVEIRKFLANYSC